MSNTQPTQPNPTQPNPLDLPLVIDGLDSAFKSNSTHSASATMPIAMLLCDRFHFILPHPPTSIALALSLVNVIVYSYRCSALVVAVDVIHVVVAGQATAMCKCC
jgi:hypothetical protein